MENETHLNAEWTRCGSCRYWSGKRRVEFINGIVRWIFCRPNERCPRDNQMRNCLHICEHYRRWVDRP